MSFFTWNREMAPVIEDAGERGPSAFKSYAVAVGTAVEAVLRRVFKSCGSAADTLTRTVSSVAPGRPWGARRRRMEMVESLTLSGRKQLFLVECDRQRYLVGGGAEGVATIVAMGEGEGARPRRAEVTGTRGLRLVRRRLDAEGHWTGYDKSAPESFEPWR